MLKIAYSFFIGILLAFFVGMGIAAFYPQPASPKYPTQLNTIDKEPTAEQRQAEKDFNIAQDKWNETMKPYNRNVSLIALASALIFVSVGLLFERRIRIIADGMVLGGIATLLYALGRGFAAQNSKYSFVVVTIALIISIALGYIRFVKLDHFSLETSAKHSGKK
ncbi:MAG: hypothetical protein ACXWLH_01920 [Candidatus Saccharimonadales bacterium]